MWNIEYLIETSFSLGSNEASYDQLFARFRKMLTSPKGISVKGVKIHFNGSLIGYKFHIIKINKTSTVFQLNFSSRVSDDFVEFYKTVEYIIHSLSKEIKDILRITKIKDDISLELAGKGYKYVFQLENELRKLIAKCLYVEYGTNWYLNNIPTSINIKLGVSKSINPLEEAYLSHLSNIIFDKIYVATIEEIQAITKDEILTDETKIKLIKEKSIPKSNWDLSFKQLFSKINENAFKGALDEFNKEFRRVIAHSKTFTIDHYIKLEKTYTFLSSHLNDALLNLDKSDLFKNIDESKTDEFELIIESNRLPRFRMCAQLFNTTNSNIYDVIIKNGGFLHEMYYSSKIDFENFKILIKHFYPELYSHISFENFNREKSFIITGTKNNVNLLSDLINNCFTEFSEPKKKEKNIFQRLNEIKKYS